jgi:hypothetical protein
MLLSSVTLLDFPVVQLQGLGPSQIPLQGSQNVPPHLQTCLFICLNHLLLSFFYSVKASTWYRVGECELTYHPSQITLVG